MDTVTVNRKIIEMNTPKNQIYRLSLPNSLLVPMTYELNDENVVMTFDTENLASGLSISKNLRVEKLRFLVNVYDLVEIDDIFQFSLDPQNIYCDINLVPLVLERDLDLNVKTENFLDKYKALVASIISPKHSYSEYISNGNGVYKSKKLKFITQAKTPLELKEILENEYIKESDKIRNTKILVGKKSNSFKKIFFPISIILMVLSLSFAGYLWFLEIPYKNSLIEANAEFTSEDYNDAIDTLQKVKPDKLPIDTKYQLAKAYVYSESLSIEQKNNVISSISLKSTENVLDYWIYIGRAEYDDAIDCGQRIGDDELLLYALLKNKASVQNDNEIIGAEKNSKLDKITSQIDGLLKLLDKKEETLFDLQEKEDKPKPAKTISTETEDIESKDEPEKDALDSGDSGFSITDAIF